jgi:ankyrin repeat domain-containing protein 50
LKRLEQKETLYGIIETLNASLSLNDVITGISRIILNDEDAKVIAWLGLNDASVNHDLAREKHEPKTGDWFLQSDMFTTWKNTRKSSLWLHGKAGSGKTILCSTIVEQIKKMCDSNSSDQHAYFYFNFNAKWTVVDMLRSIIAQLCTCQKQIPLELRQMYDQCLRDQRQPHKISLLKMFYALSTTSYRTFIILDALDECAAGRDRNELLDTIEKMIESSSVYLNILITSRKEKDIEDKLTRRLNTLVGLEETVIDADIALHIQERLKNDEKLSIWDSSTKENVQDALIKGAHGM